jgi:hypothetical protein
MKLLIHFADLTKYISLGLCSITTATARNGDRFMHYTAAKQQNSCKVRPPIYPFITL